MCMVPRGLASANSERGSPPDRLIADWAADPGCPYFLMLRSSELKEVRGKGLWIGIELRSPARRYCEALKEQGILCKEMHDRSNPYRTAA